VTFAGEPIQEGEIRFQVAGHSAEAGPIRDGLYTARVSPGTATVSIYGYRVSENAGPAPQVTGTEPIKDNFVPERYNTKTELTAEIKGDTNDLSFDLQP
jgi:hypothetical protein